jgi:peptide/nickel transport system substrate-binding protein
MIGSYWDATLKRRLSRRRAIGTAAGLSAGAALLAACGGGSGDDSGGDKSSLIVEPADTTKQAARGGTMKWYVDREPNTLDVHVNQNPLNTPKNMAYSQLTIIEAGHLKPTELEVIGDMAESWEWSPDRLQVTMKLRQGIKWHNKAPINGRVMDVDDIVFSWNRYATKATDRSDLANSANPNAPVLSVTAVDPRTISIKLKEPVVYLLAALAATTSGKPIIVPKEADDTFEIRRDMIGTGPYMLDKYTTSVGFTWKRNPDYYDKTFPLIDAIETPILLEYAAGLAQLKAGNLYHFAVRPEDILSVKRDIPELNIYKYLSTAVSGGDSLRFGWQPTDVNRPFRDERVRQAVSMSYDRELYIDTFSNAATFEAEGLPVDTYWYTALGNAPGWWLDPRSRDFGPNAKYFQYDVAEAKKLLASAGFPNGLEVTSTYVAGTERGVDYQKTVEVREEFARQAGFKINANLVDYNTVYIPKLRDGRGAFEGWAYTGGSSLAEDAVAYMIWRYYSKGGVTFLGFDVNGRGDASGDPALDAMIDKAKGEPDTEKRRALVYDMQRHLAKAVYAVSLPGSASSFQMAWPALQNFGVYQTERRTSFGGVSPYYHWLDETKAPFKRA